MGTATPVLPDLAQIRSNRGISLQEIARSTKITLRYLEAIERGEFEKLPGGVYAMNYVRQYARVVDFDEGMLAEHCRKVLERTS